jgi:hypothetical protein
MRGGMLPQLALRPRRQVHAPDVNQIRGILANFDRQYFAAIFTENSRVACILGAR